MNVYCYNVISLSHIIVICCHFIYIFILDYSCGGDICGHAVIDQSVPGKFECCRPTSFTDMPAIWTCRIPFTGRMVSR